MIIRIKNNQRKQKLAATKLKAQLTKLLGTLDLPDAELSVLFVGDRAMRTLNQQYRGKDRTTDVLSFALQEGRFNKVQPNMLGDIVISVPTAGRQAVDAGLTLQQELERLLVHGLLHLIGYDHERGAAHARSMHMKERSLLKRLRT
ncbi:MAG: rRNA maturation RNase YbeY [Nitrospirae bacterium GWC2_56_14]|nr:MAG: rRNA maturation RNase YbeY [Nitrospirae bacterium GWC2_56_14]